jgi:hypothetical protein
MNEQILPEYITKYRIFAVLQVDNPAANVAKCEMI